MKTTKTNATKRNAARQYDMVRTEIDGLLASVRRGLKAHGAKFDGRDWGFVGDLDGIASTLRDLSDRLHGTGEYAN